MAIDYDKMKGLLIRSLDEPLDTAEAKDLAVALKLSSELREEKRQLLAIRELLRDMGGIPAPNIADAVIKEVQRPALNRQLSHMLPKVAAACILLLLGGILGIYFSEGSLSAEAIIGVNELSPEDVYTYLNY